MTSDRQITESPNYQITKSFWFTRDEVQRDAVDAVALIGRGRTVGKDVTEMSAAARAVHFYSRHAIRAILVVSVEPAFGAKKLGHPVPELNFVSFVKSSCPHPAQ